MYKTIVLFFTGFLLIATQRSFAQKDSTLSQKITNKFCEEFSKKNFTTYSESEAEIGLIILPIITKYSKEIEREWNLFSDNQKDFGKIAEKIGQNAATGCPKFFQFVRNNLNEISATDGESFRSLTGILQRLEGQQFSCLVIKTKSGKEEKLWWFQFFEGSEELSQNLKSLLKKNITVKYTEMEVYDLKLKEYRSIKVIKSLTKD